MGRQRPSGLFLIYLGAFGAEGKPHYLQPELHGAALQLGGAPGWEGTPLCWTGRAGAAFKVLKGGGFCRRGVSCILVRGLCLPLLQRWGWWGEGLASVYSSVPADVAGQREEGWWRGAELGGGEADPPLPRHQMKPGRADSSLAG